MTTLEEFFFKFIYFFETKCWHANAKAQEVVDHLAIFMSCREEISQLGTKLPTSSLRFGYLSTIIKYFKVISDQP